MSEFAKAGDTSVAAAAIVIAALTNTLVKCGIAIVLAGLTLGKPLLIATAAMLLAGLAAALLRSRGRATTPERQRRRR
jgi:uncharacterized membrane protein (DUF4010 family)